MKRDITEKLVDWARSPYRMPLLLTGIRHCGKTYALQDLGEREFGGDCAYFNFEQNERLRRVFEGDLVPRRILDDLCMLHGKAIVPGKTLVIFDEIQCCLLALTSLKYFCEEMPELHVACAGSLLSVTLNHTNERFSFPVGKVERMRMYPMCFREFYDALNPGYLDFFDSHYQFGTSLSAPLMHRFEDALKKFYIVGGMPEAVSAWVETKDMSLVEKIQDNILNDYQNDFSKHAPKELTPALNLVWDSVPVQLAKENNKFVFAHVKEAKSTKVLEDAIGWLANAGLVHKLELVEKPTLPLCHRKEPDKFKLYMADVGLLRRKANIPVASVILHEKKFLDFKGAFTENFAMGELLSLGKTPYFWRSSNQAEVDFIFQEESSLVPVEVKADTNTKAKSFRVFCDKYQPEYGFKLSLKNVGEHEVGSTKVYSLPLYLAGKIQDCIEVEKEKGPKFDMAAWDAEIQEEFRKAMEAGNGLFDDVGKVVKDASERCVVNDNKGEEKECLMD